MSDINASNGYPPGYTPGSWWFYAPNKGAPVAFAVLFAVSGLAHAWQCHKYSSWKATGFLPWAALIFVLGFIVRAVGAWNYTDLELYITSSVLLYAAPPVYETANFFTLSRLMYYVPYHAPMNPARIITTFVSLQVVVEALNASGAVLVANYGLTPGQHQTGSGLLKAALLTQLFSMVAFPTLALWYERNCRRSGLFPSSLRSVLRVLYVSCMLITIRTVYRTTEWFDAASISFADPRTFPTVLQREWFFWVFEATLLVTNTYLLNVFHPSKYLPRNLKVYLARDGAAEVEGPGFEDRRPYWMVILDPFDVTGLFLSKQGRETWSDAPGIELVAVGIRGEDSAA